MLSTRPVAGLAAGLLSAVALAAAPSAHAVVVYSLVNLVIPNTGTGLYVNVVDGSTFTGPGTFPTLGGPGSNYDFNLFGTTTWTTFSPGSSGQSAPTPVPVTSKGYVSATSTGGVLNLAPGTLIGGSSVYNTGGPSPTAIVTGAPAIFGFRFRNENVLADAADDTIHYGWARVVLTNGVPGTLIDYAYESVALTGIQAGVSPIPEPGTALLMAGGVLALLARSRRGGRA